MLWERPPIDLSILQIPIPLIFELNYDTYDTRISPDTIHPCTSALQPEEKHIEYKAIATILGFVSSINDQLCQQRPLKASFIDIRASVNTN